VGGRLRIHPLGISERASETERKAAAEYMEASFTVEGVAARILAARKRSS
jgi:hypothetical protein